MSAQLTICVLACEFPFDPSSRGVALLLPLSDFCLKQLRRGDALSGALPIHNPDFDLRHVQPTGVLGGVVELDALQQRRCCSLTQHIHESLPKVRVEVVQNEMNDERRRIHRLYKVLDEGHKVHFGAAGGDSDAPLFALGFDGYKEIARPVAPVFVVLTSIPARLDSYRRTGLAKQLLALLIDAHHGFPRIVRTSIETQQPIHPVAILGRDPADAPHQLAPGLAVAGFPANDFKSQEPGTSEEIQTFCTANFGVDFPMFEKIPVVGPDKHPLYAALIAAQPKATSLAEVPFSENLKKYGIAPNAEPEILWNFEKFVVSRSGEVVRRFSPDTEPSNPALIEAIETELAKA